MDGEVITAMRTAAASAVATKYLAQRTQVLSVLGCGTQARSHIEAFLQLFAVEKVHPPGIDPLQGAGSNPSSVPPISYETDR